ncbi:indole-3-glycerol phosphate synthase [Hyphomonas neptunium ATCC 15444]|uniref:Indole-3-glycerol phosphate synthase n=2 Tax=Hyphomonas TaxID=85 RepID=TRPC_HYPNA|nr:MULTISPECIES: indole-3-glycerol phosphate synthase TrpC [Hyphomonas]Q0C1A2.1 RecName: Full=Indole-3-glycerol phosphate synthase; Short=IGPS [Hyphomonas neptunium ATCC 15444]ABI78452.1 indole-3-glycerol phosphate synthase [Hyphomonas neptunium ATCC 15444]KCZ95096.1 indole-3-glycerol phosphate synthase [Hyphomonas hirschiana VP5]
MKTALDRIIDYKRDEVRALKKDRSLGELENAAAAASPVRGFGSALSAIADADQNALICEIKRKSPSAGDILPGADPVEIALDYERGGAACLSVLTDMPSFGGSLADFETIRAAVSIPMLRKDFMIDPIQIIEARAHGADCILIIMSAIDDTLAGELHDCASRLGMDVLVETHDEAEMERALRLPSPLIGVNNRDLKKMVTDLGTTERLAPMLSSDRQLIAESGIADPESIIRLRKVGSRRFLIGEWLMKQGTSRAEQVTRLKLAC